MRPLLNNAVCKIEQRFCKDNGFETAICFALRINEALFHLVNAEAYKYSR